MADQKQYAPRDIIALDEAGGYYSRHVSAMTSEGMYSKSTIAAELAWRDAEIDRLRASPPAGQQAEPTNEQIASMAAILGICPPLVSYGKVTQLVRALFKLAHHPSERWVRCEFCHQLTDRNRVDPLHPSERPAPEGQAVGEPNEAMLVAMVRELMKEKTSASESWEDVMRRCYLAALAASQAERTAGE